MFGTFDPSVATQKTTYGDNKSVSQNFIRNSSQGTSQVTFKGEEDLGGGLKAAFLLENDFDTRFDANGNPYNGKVNFGSGGGEQFLGLMGDFGSVKIGSANTPSLYAQANRNPFGTKIGSGFGGVLGASHVRSPNSLVYGSPVFAGGLSFGLAYSFKTNADANAATAYDISKGPSSVTTTTVTTLNTNVTPNTATSTSTSTLNNAASLNTKEVGANTDFGLNYANGPLSAQLSFWNTDAVSGGAKNKQTNFNAAYDFGMAKVFVGMHAEKTEGSLETAGKNIGVSVPLNAQTSLLANAGRLDDKRATNLDKKIAAVGVKYTLSNRTSVYARYVDEKNDNVTATGSAKAIRTGLVGLQHNF